MHREASEPDGIFKALTEFAGSGVELLVVNAGDGTVQAVLTHLGNQMMFARPPLFCLLCAGTTSMLPRDVGMAGRPVAALQRVLNWSRSTNGELNLQKRAILRIQRDTDALFGMFFGAGAICDGIRIFHNRDNPMGWRGQLMPMLTMARLLLAVLCNRVPPFVHTVSLDRREPEQRSDLFILASTLELLFLGMRPFWGTGHAPLRYTAVSARPKYLLWVLSSLFGLGGRRYAKPENGYFSHNAEQIKLAMQGDFTLDGELYAAGNLPVAISTAGEVLFVCSGKT